MHNKSFFVCGKEGMATPKKISRPLKRKAPDTLIERDQIISNPLQAAVEWSNDHEFISPNEIYMNAIGLLFCLTTRHLSNPSFTNLYRKSLKITWADLLSRERKILKPNMNSVAKCFMINRLIAECHKDPYKFARQTGELYEEIKMRMSSSVTLPWTPEDFYGQVLSRQNLQRQRRLFHMNHDEANQPYSLLTLQLVANKLCLQFLTSYRQNLTMENYSNLKNFLQHSFIIVAQPSIPECVAAAKYEKTNNVYSAKLYTRIICLIDPDIVNQYFTLSSVGVTLRPFDTNVDFFGDDQRALLWRKRPIVDANEALKSFLYVELESIELNKTDIRNLRPLYSAKLCLLDFYIKIRINEMDIEENVTLSSQLFGVCSHAQYYPEYVAKVLLYEVTQMPQSSGSIVQPNVLTNYIYRYHTRISGVEVKMHTSQYINDIIQMAYERRKTLPNADSFDVYEEIVAKLLSQMEMFIDYPFLSMMYHDGLFLGICDSTLDQQLHGTREQPHILLRFNTLSTHHAIQHPSVRFIVHNGQLIRATFHPKAFVDEMCRMICEANSSRAEAMQLLFEDSHRNFHDFRWYFDHELFRLNTAASPITDAHKPLIPVLWNIMKINTDEQQINSPLSSSELIPLDLSPSSFSSTSEIPIDLSNIGVLSDTATASNETGILQTDRIVRHLVEKLSDILAKSSTTTDTATASTLLPTLISGDIQQQQELLSHLLSDYLPSNTHVDVATQTSSLESTEQEDL